MDVYKQLVEATRAEIKKYPTMTDEQLDGYLVYVGVFAPHMRKQIIKEAKE